MEELREEVIKLSKKYFSEKNKSKNIVGGKKGIALKMPMFVNSSNMFLANLGPSVYVPVNLISNSIL